jgi:RNA polymerase sigma-70 factor (ECF subfamily)
VADDLRRQIVEFLPRLRRFAYALTGDKEQGDDLVQEACVRALSRLHLWQAGTRLDSWIYRIAQNLWFDRMRSKKIRGKIVDIDTLHGLAGDDGRSVTEDRLTLSIVSNAIDRLPPEQKVLIALVCIEGFTYKEAADILEIPTGTVMSRLARARRALYAEIHELEEGAAARQMGNRRGRSVG